jgi:hypothetical protein
MLNQTLGTLVQQLYANPCHLTKKCPEMQKRLQSQGKEESDGTGNKVTNQEAAFAQLLEDSGFTWIAKPKKDTWKEALMNQGLCFLYQLNGTQASVDFALMYVQDSKILETFYVDLKYSTSTKIFLNDGWFEPNILYLFTWTERQAIRVFVGLAKDFTTEEESNTRSELRKQLAELNSKQKVVGKFHMYVRCANTYNLKTFTKEFSEVCRDKAITWIQTVASPSSDVVLSSPSQEQKKPSRALKKSLVADATE